MASSKRGILLVLLTAILATLAKLYCAFTTFGTDDVALYYRYGQVVEAEGFELALKNPIFNLTPVAAEYPAMLTDVLQGKRKLFPFFLKLPGILASFGSVLALIWLQRRMPRIPTYALILFAASPVAFMIDGFHGNFDSVMVFLILLAGCACVAKEPNWLLCAAGLAMASQVKVVALLVAPVFAFFWFYRGRGIHFVVTCSVAVILGWLPGLLADPLPYLKNVVGYGSVWGAWGITYLLHLTGLPEFSTIHWIELSKAQILTGQILKVFIIALVLWSGWRNRKNDAQVLFGTLAFCWMIFFALAPGMGMQYMVWFAPFLLVSNARWYIALTVIVSGVLFSYYQITCGAMPWFRADSLRFKPYTPLLLVPWIAFVICTVALLLKFKHGQIVDEKPLLTSDGDSDASEPIT